MAHKLSSTHIKFFICRTAFFELLILFFISCATGVPEKKVAQLYYNLGNAYFELGEYGDSVKAYLNAIELGGDLPQAGYNLARVYIESGRITEGIKELQGLLESDPGNSILMSTLGWAYFLSDDYEKSVETYEEILERMPTDVNGLYNAAVLSWELGRKEKALSLYELLYVETDDEEILFEIAIIHIDLEAWQDAIDNLLQYIAAKDSDPDAYYFLGIAYAAERYYGEALAAFESAIELQNEDPILYFEKAVILLLYIENLDEGIKSLQKAVELGFSDQERIKDLVASEILPFKSEVEDFLQKSGLLVDPPTESDQIEVDGLPGNGESEESY